MQDTGDKIFFGKVFAGKFHDATAETDLSMIVDRDSFKLLFEMFSKLKQTGELKPGMVNHEKYGPQAKLRIRKSLNGNYYAEIDTYQPGQNQENAIPEAETVPAEPEDLPF